MMYEEWLTTKSDYEKQKAKKFILWGLIIGLILFINLLITGFPNLWTPIGGEFILAFLTVGLILCVYLIAHGVNIFVEDWEVRHHQASHDSVFDKIEDPISGTFGIFSHIMSILLLVCIVLVIRYIYLLLF